MPKTAKNLYLDPDVIERAEEYSRRHGTNLSTLVSDYLDAPTRLDALPRRVTHPRHGPLVQRLLGAGVPRAQGTRDLLLGGNGAVVRPASRPKTV